jgi:hypothetical protein
MAPSLSAIAIERRYANHSGNLFCAIGYRVLADWHRLGLNRKCHRRYPPMK